MVLILVTTAATTLSALYVFSDSLERESSKIAMIGVEGMKNELDTLKKDATVIASVIALNPSVTRAVANKDADALILALAPLMKETGLDFATVSDENGTVIVRTHAKAKGDSVINQANVQNALQGKVFGAIEAGTGVKLSARAGVPVKNEQGRVIGVVSAGFDSTKDTFVDRVKKKYGTDVTLFSGDERIATTLVKDGKRVIGTKLNQKIAALVLGQGQKYNARADILGMDYFTAYLPVVGFDNKPIGVVFAGESTANFVAERNRLLLILVLIALGTICLGAVVAVFVARGIANPIKAVLANVQEVAAGNLAIGHISSQSKDEIGQLGDAVNTMTDNLRRLIKQVSQSSEQVAASSEQLTASAQQSADASGNIAGSIQQVAEGSQKQVGAVNDTSAIVQEISATMEEVSATASEMAVMSEQTAKAAVEGKTSVDRAVTQMNEVSVGARQAQAAAEDLKASSAQIGEIVGLISTIAGQTNLLALNAAIEAARAGEQGRGFAVVAEEVRKLAEQSEQAAHQIKQLVGSNHSSIGNVVGAIDMAIGKISQGVELVNVAGTNFGAINGQIGQVTDQVRIIAKAINEAAVGSQKIVSSIREVENLSRDAAAESQNVSAATEEQSASMEEIAASSQALAKLAEELQKAVSKFRV